MRTGELDALADALLAPGHPLLRGWGKGCRGPGRCTARLLHPGARLAVGEPAPGPSMGPVWPNCPAAWRMFLDRIKRLIH